MIKPNPFTPQSGWEPRVFSGRKNALALFAATLDEAISSRPTHMIVLGEWGTGKTSLLKQFKRLSQSKGHPACFCGLARFTGKDKPLDALYLMAEEMMMDLPGLASCGEELLELFSRKKSLVQAQAQFSKFLMRLWNRIRAELVVVLIDDLQNLLPLSNTIDILRAVLSREDILKNTRFLFVLSSTPSSWSMFIDKHDPVGRFFRRRLLVENLAAAEVEELIERTLEGTGVGFEKEIKDKIFSYTGGHPYEVQLLSSNLYDNQISGRVDLKVWDNALISTLRDLGRDYFTTLLLKASEREKELLEILAREGRPLSLKEFRNMMIVGRYARKFPIANIKNFLYRMEAKGIISRDLKGNFDIPDLMFREFILRSPIPR